MLLNKNIIRLLRKNPLKKKIKTVCQESLKAANAIETLGQIGSKNHS